MKKNLNNWYRLDNTAKIFSLDDKTNTNIFRYSIILKQNIDKKTLQSAIEKTIQNYKKFKVKIATGFFWNYLEYNSKKIIIRKEDEFSCQHINFNENNDYLFKVTYHENKINLDIFHVLTDGVGAIEFFKSIIYNYLSQKYNLQYKENINNINIIQDQYIRNYDKNIKADKNYKIAYQIPKKTNKNVNNTYHYIIDLQQLKLICRNYKVSITEYLTAIYIFAIYLAFYEKNTKEEIIISIPINLRKYYQVKTTSNFFTCMNINPKIIENNLTTFEDILKQVHKEFEEKLTIDKIKSYLTRDVELGMNIFVRLVPLFIKKSVIKTLKKLISKTSTSTLSNIGKIDIDNKYKNYIENIFALVIPDINQKIKCTICSFDNKLNITINSNINDSKFQRIFLEKLQTNIKDIKLESINLS